MGWLDDKLQQFGYECRKEGPHRFFLNVLKPGAAKPIPFCFTSKGAALRFLITINSELFK